MALALSGATPINVTTGAAGDANTRQKLVTFMENQLTTAGWTVISGGGSATVTLRSGTPADQNPCQLIVRDPGSGNTARIQMQSNSATKTSGDFFLLPGASTVYRIIANAYQFFIFRTDVIPVARECVHGGVLFCPLFNIPAGDDPDVFWLWGNGQNDTSTSTQLSLINSMTSSSAQKYACYGGNHWTSIGAGIGQLGLVFPNSSGGGEAFNRWMEGSAKISEPLLTAGLTSPFVDRATYGLIWDAAIVGDSFLHGILLQFPSVFGGADKSWFVLRDSGNVSLVLFVPTP